MTCITERRHQDRMRFHWPVWFGYEDNGSLFRGQVVDLGAGHLGFSVSGNSDEPVPSVGDHILVRFSYPIRHNTDFEMGRYFHWGEIIRVNDHVCGTKRMALRLHQPLPKEHFENQPSDCQQAQRAFPALASTA